MEFLNRYYNPFRAPTQRCSLCGRPALHQGRRDGFTAEFCCNCVENLTGEVCLGHPVAGAEDEITPVKIHILTVSDEQIDLIWQRISCSIHGVCTPPCQKESGTYGCCHLCDQEYAACPERCEL